MLDLELDTANPTYNHRLPLLERLGDFHLEAFSDGELEDGVRVAQERVEELVVWLEALD